MLNDSLENDFVVLGDHPFANELVWHGNIDSAVFFLANARILEPSREISLGKLGFYVCKAGLPKLFV